MRIAYLMRVLGEPLHPEGCACHGCVEDRERFGSAGVLGEVLAEVRRRRRGFASKRTS